MENADQTTAHAWVGRSVLDREGATLGAVTAVVDDAHGERSWLVVRGAGVSGFVPTDGAVETDGDVKVSVTRAQVIAAPRTALPDRVTEFEAAALRRHYARGPEQPDGSGPNPLVLASAATGFLALLFWVVRRLRLRAQPPTPTERLAEVGRTTSTAVAHRAKELADTATVAAGRASTVAGRATTAASKAATAAAATAAPVVGEAVDEAGRVARRGAKAGAELAELAGRTVAVVTPVAVTAAGAAAHQVAERATHLASGAGELAARAADTGHRVTEAVTEVITEVPEAVAESVAETVEELQRTWRKATNRLTFMVFLAVGYVLGARAGTERYNAIVQLASRATGKEPAARRPDPSRPTTTPDQQPLSTTTPGGNTME